MASRRSRRRMTRKTKSALTSLSTKLRTIGKTRKSRRKWRRSSNFWRQWDTYTFSKILVTEAELLWLEINAPDAVVEWKKVPDCESVALYRSGRWHGYALFVSFDKKSLDSTIEFRANWWKK